MIGRMWLHHLNLKVYFTVVIAGVFVHCTNNRIISGHNVRETEYSIDTYGGVWTTFDGIGAISGGGATSKLLVNYPEPYRSDILDYLFKPQFGASLQILKVEIGGDSQSSDGSESSHMHTPDDANYNRGYEWWLMKEAKKRNPGIKLYGLPWTFPGWVGGGIYDPFVNRSATVKYIMNWIKGARQEHGLIIDYIGVWNERTCDKEYVKLLRATLNQEGFKNIKIVAPDAQSWGILDDFNTDKDFLSAVDIIGQHYPGATTPDKAFHFEKTLWASEEYSTVSDLAGGGCWARVLSESPVNGFYTGFIAWNLITGYYNGLPYTMNSLMTANEPWSGHYDVASPVWISAHHTQFYQPGWFYLHHGHGVDRLQGNGTVIALTSPDWKQLTVVIETMDPNDSPCAYYMPRFTVAEQQLASFRLAGSYSAVTQLYVWYSRLDFKGNTTVLFEKRVPLQVVNGKFSLLLSKNEIYTLSTDPVGVKGDRGKPPAPAPFPIPYKDTFDSYQIGEEPYNLAQQSGAFEVTDSQNPVHGMVMTQVVTQPPVDTCLPDRIPHPITLIGDYSWNNVSLQIDVLLTKSVNDSERFARGVFIASNVDTGGCWTMYANGIYFWVSVEAGVARLTANQTGSALIAQVAVPNVQYGQWFTMSLDVTGNKVQAKLNDDIIMSVVLKQPSSKHGFVTFGPDSFGIVHFDNLYILRADRAALCPENAPKTDGFCNSAIVRETRLKR